MPNDAMKPKSSSFLSEGWRELKRKLERRSLRARMAQGDKERQAALARLGQRAWEAGVGLSDFGELGVQIKALEARTGELSSTSQRLEGERSAAEERRRNELARFDAQRKALDDIKRPIDTSLRDLGQQQSTQQREAQRAESRLAAIAGEIAGIEKQLAATPSPAPAQAAAGEARKQQLVAEQAQLNQSLPQARQAAAALSPEIERLKQESQRYANEIAKLEGERKAALAQIDSTIERLRGELKATSQQSQATGVQRADLFLKFGAGVYEKKKGEPALAEAVAPVKKAEDDSAAAAALLRASLALTQAMPGGTLAKFFLTLFGTPVLLIGLIVGGYFVYDYTRPDERVIEPKPINRYLQHSLKDHAAYTLANQLVEARSEQEVAAKLTEALKKIHVGIYTVDGKQLLAGAERSQNDFFLYDFQVKILAHAFFLRNGMAMATHTRMLGKALLELEQPAEMEPVFNAALTQRYREAEQKPDDPMSFITLLTDGLARQQVEPYSLDETHRFERANVDPIQSFLIMLDFFLRPPPPKGPTGLNWFPSLVTTAYAQGPCDGILGDDAQGYYGRGTDVFTEVVGALPNMAGKVVSAIGNVTGVGGAIADLLILYGMNIKLTPEPYTVHLVHDSDDSDMMFIQALVTFDAQGVPDAVLKCGWMAGKQMPANGPLKDVELKWDFFPALRPHLEMSSEMLRGPNPRIVATAGGLRTNTNEAGTSSFLITVKQCPDKRGLILGQDYMAMVTARYVTKSIPTPGMLGFGLILKLGPGALEYLMGGRNGYVRFRAEWHKKKPEKPHY
jgi:predicted  nucleic acid-binding Zn-ribbon protein